MRRWWIDAERGWNPVRVTMALKGNVMLDTRIALAKSDGVWFPRSIQTYHKSWREMREPYETFEVSKAEFNRPEHEHDFSPQTIGIYAGMPLELHDNMLRRVAFGFFDGHGYVTTDAYFDQLRVRRAASQPVVNWEPARARLAGWQAEWERYVSAFIERYQLNTEQQEQAHRTLRECIEQAEQYLRRRGEQIQRIVGVLEGAANDAADRAAYGQLLIRLARPIDDIYEQRLKARLEKPPTRKQRALSTQPSRP